MPTGRRSRACNWRDAAEIHGSQAQRARLLYGEKFAVIRGLAQAPVALAQAMDKVRWYKVVPQRLYFIDNAAGFGHRDEIELPRHALAGGAAAGGG
jgi:uncharacterized protein YhbP (UPF0306 family)